jgi:hypothetical protein
MAMNENGGPAAAERTHACAHCGTTLAGGRFCPGCGTAASSTPTDTPFPRHEAAAEHAAGVADRGAPTAPIAQQALLDDIEATARMSAQPAAHRDGSPPPPVRPHRVRVAFGAGSLGLLVGLAAVIVTGLIVGTGRLAGESDESKAATIMRLDAAEVSQLAVQVNGADRVSDLQQSGVDAQSVQRRLDDRRARLVALEDAKVRDQALGAHRAIVAIAEGYGGLSDVDARHLKAWAPDARAIVSAVTDLEASAPNVAALDTERPVRFRPSAVNASVEHATTYLSGAAKKMARYKRRLAAYERKHRAEIQAATSYQGAVLGQISAYRSTRTDLQKYLTDSKTFDAQIDDFRSTLQAQRDKRQSIRGTIASLTAPAGVSSAQQALMGVLDKAIAATGVGIDLADATQRLRDEEDFETSGFDLPEYSRFKDLSDEISRELDPAVASWNGAIAGALERIRNGKGAPKKPTI